MNSKVNALVSVITNKTISAVLVASVLFLNSCKKELPSPAGNETAFNQITETQLSLNNTVLKLQNELPVLLEVNNGSHKTEQDFIGNLDCAKITRDTTVNPHIAYFDFGTTGCTGSDGMRYSGSITLQYNASDLTQPGNVWTFTFANFIQDSMNLNGTMTLRNEGNNANGNSVSSVAFNFRTNYGKDGLSYNGTSTFYIESINEGYKSTKGQLFTGSGTAYATNGTQYMQTITSPLKVKLDPACGHFVSGTFVVHYASSSDRVIDYGNGTCDNKATMTMNGLSHPITLY